MLAQQNRLKKQSDFAQVAKYGRKRHSSFFIFYIYRPKKPQQHPRFGIVISQKVSKKATERNLLRRWIRSDLYINKKNLTPLDYMIVVKKQAIGKSHQEISTDLNKTCY